MQQTEFDPICAMRVEAEENMRELENRTYPHRSIKKEAVTETNTESYGSFFLRTSLSLLIFCGFLWLSHENRTVLGMTPQNVQEVLGTSVVLQEWTESDKIMDDTTERDE